MLLVIKKFIKLAPPATIAELSNGKPSAKKASPVRLAFII